MTVATVVPEQETSSRRGAPPLAADSLALGMAFLLALTVVQRLIGLLRNILFCRLLNEEELGLWSLGFSFLVLAAPLAVLGLPGSFGRYVEHFRQRGQLRGFLRRTTWATLVLGLSASLAIGLGREWFSQFIFGESSQTALLLALGVALAATIGLNYLGELLTALRQSRAVSLIQFAQSMVFTVIGLTLLYFTSWGAAGLAAAHALACGLACLGAIPILRRLLREDERETPLSRRDMWGKLLPYAAWIWAINILANLSEIADRYLVLHWSGFDPHTALGLVGQLHASRVVPVLMIGVATLVGGALLPYLSHDWETGRRDLVANRLNLALKLLGLAFTGGSALILLLAPVLFGWLLQGRYNGGLSVLPLSLTYCVWFSLGLVAHNYLLCAEQNKLGGLAFAITLACNVALNLLLLPSLGLHGAALATAISNGALLAVMLVLCRRVGMPIEPGTVLICLSPLLLPFGAWTAAAGAMLMLLLCLWGRWLLAEEEKQELFELVIRLVRRTNVVSRPAEETARD